MSGFSSFFFFKWPNDSLTQFAFQSKGIFFFFNVSLWHKSQRKNDGGLQWRYICSSSRSPPSPPPPPSTPSSSSPSPPPPPSTPPSSGVGCCRTPSPTAHVFGSCGRRRSRRSRSHVKPWATTAILPIAGAGSGSWTSCGSPSSGTGRRRRHSQGAPSSALASPATAAGH